MIIDAKNAVLGRMASGVAKKLLAGEKISIINAEQAIMTGNPNKMRNYYLERKAKGSPHHGPFTPKRPDLIVRRVIRGMLPYKKPKGRDAMKRLKIFIGFPDYVEGKQIMTIEESIKEIKTKYIKVGNLAKAMGYRN